jgi:PAS domain-containing protein
MSAAATVSLPGPAALRALARAFGQFDNFDRFVAALQGALERSTGFEHSLIALDAGVAEGASKFPPGTLSLPLLGDQGVLGALQVAAGGERRPFGAEDLHLLAGLADFLGAVLAQARRAQDAGRGRELLRLLLNQAPVGIAAFGLDRRPIVANESAARWLGGSALPFAEFEAGNEIFHLRAEGKLISGEARRITDSGGAWVVVLHDLTSEQSRLLDGLHREVYRALAENQPCGVALIESIDLRNGALRRLPAVRAALRGTELAGPYDANRIGLVLAGGGLALRARLRELQPIFAGLPELRLGYAELGRDGRAPDALLGAALQRWGRCADVLRPAVLVQDENPAVADALALVLHRDFRVVKSPGAARTRELLAAENFEGFIAELEPRSGPTGTELAREARQLQPGIQSFLTAIGSAPLATATGATVIEKPFDVAALTTLLNERLQARWER